MGILELHFHDSEFKPSMHVGPKETADTAQEAVETVDEPTGGGRPLLLALVAAGAALAVGAVAVKKFRG